jgi:hypothetical protein
MDIRETAISSAEIIFLKLHYHTYKIQASDTSGQPISIALRCGIYKHYFTPFQNTFGTGSHFVTILQKYIASCSVPSANRKNKQKEQLHDV